MPSRRPASGAAPPAPATPGTRASASASPLATLRRSYVAHTPARLRLLDAFMVFLVLSGVVQFAYCVLVSNFPFNSFVAG